MGMWLECEDTKGNTVYVNFDNAISIKADTKGQAWIAFMGDEKVHIVVSDTPKELITRLEMARKQRS